MPSVVAALAWPSLALTAPDAVVTVAEPPALDALDQVTPVQQASDTGHMLAATLLEDLRHSQAEVPVLDTWARTAR